MEGLAGESDWWGPEFYSPPPTPFWDFFFAAGRHDSDQRAAVHAVHGGDLLGSLRCRFLQDALKDRQTSAKVGARLRGESDNRLRLPCPLTSESTQRYLSPVAFTAPITSTIVLCKTFRYWRRPWGCFRLAMSWCRSLTVSAFPDTYERMTKRQRTGLLASMRQRSWTSTARRNHGGCKTILQPC